MIIYLYYENDKCNYSQSGETSKILHFNPKQSLDRERYTGVQKKKTPVA